MNRRKFLKIAGAGGVIVAAGGVGFVTTRTPTAALQPWQDAGSLYSDPLRRALSYAILAPNPHNRQPWVVDLKSETEAVLTCDLDRLLPATDPLNRQIVIGLGCFLETFALAAQQQGYRADIELFPDGASTRTLDNRPVAKLSLIKDSTVPPDRLFSQVLHRRTNREAYDIGRIIPSNVLRNLHQHASTGVKVGTVGEGARLGQFRVLTRDAMFGEMRTAKAHKESIDLMRIGRSEIEANPDGISLGGPFLEALSLTGMLTRETLGDPSSSAFQTGLDMIETGAMSSMGFVWINTDGNDRSEQIAAGRTYMRVCLQATADGLAMQPMSQALQEYPEMAKFYKMTHSWLTDQSDERVQMLARIGYAKAVPVAPRWPLATRIKGA
jgi:hypothetical protein